MPVPVLLVTGFLGAGKTTLVSRLLSEPGGRRLAAVVNDFGAINIDAALIAATSGDVVSLKNGCICCTLQGDLLRTLRSILQRTPVPDGIVIETSGVSDPAEIVRAMLDPFIWREASLDAVVCLADCRHLADDPALLSDGLYQSQLRAADFLGLTKSDLASPGELGRVRTALARWKPERLTFDMGHGAFPHELLFMAGLHQPQAAGLPARGFSTPQFESMSWTSRAPMSLRAFQAAIGRLAPRLLRAKGFLRTTDDPGRLLVFQLVGARATVSPADPAPDMGEDAAQIVLISRIGQLDRAEVHGLLQGSVQPDTAGAAPPDPAR